MVGKLTQMAYNGVAGYTERLQIKICGNGLNVSRLCEQYDQYGVTVRAKVKNHSRRSPNDIPVC